MWKRVRTALVGDVVFAEDEEYVGFRFVLMIVIIWISTLCTLALLIGDASGANPLPSEFTRFATGYAIVSVASALIARG